MDGNEHELDPVFGRPQSTVPVRGSLLQDLKALIDQGRHQAVAAVNSAITLTYYVGKRINDAVLLGERAEYGKQVVSSLAHELVAQYGKSFEAKNLRRMMQFAEVFPDVEIVVPLARQLSWSHFLALIPLKSVEARLFYAQKSGESRWGKRELRNQIERQEGEEAPIGLILCAEAGTEQVELLNMQKDNILVAEYWTDLPPKELLENKLHNALIEVRERLAERKLLNSGSSAEL